MHCIVVPVKFDGWLSTSVLRNEQLFTKKLASSKPISFQRAQILKSQILKSCKSRRLEKRTDHPLGKSPTLLE
jgi:hypothetical protein